MCTNLDSSNTNILRDVSKYPTDINIEKWTNKIIYNLLLTIN